MRRAQRCPPWLTLRSVCTAALLLAPLATAPLASPADADDSVSATRATVALQQRYTALRSLDSHRRPVDVPQELPLMRLPFRSVVEGLLRHAGFDVTIDPEADAAVHVSITCDGTTRGQLYDAAVRGQRIRELRYSDARISGHIAIAAAEHIVERDFSGQIRPSITIIGIVDGGDPRRDPVYAPFREALEAPDGFLDAIGALMREIWGEAPLRSALEDHDPLVREAARRALRTSP